MKNIFNKKAAKICVILVFVYLLQVILSNLFIRQISYNQNLMSLHALATRVRSDIRINGGKWDMSLYAADPATPSPNGSSGFDLPLYIVTKDGFVIERNDPINGLFDTSDFKRLLTLQSPQTISALTGEKWRVISRPIPNLDTVEGVIFVTYYNPDPALVPEIDKDLNANLDKIYSQLQFKNGQIDASKVDIRNVHYAVSFEIVDSFNKVLINNGRTPSFIDPSYVETELGKPRERVITNAKTGAPYIILSEPIYDDKNKTLEGIMLIGKPFDTWNTILKTYIIYSLITMFLLVYPLSVIISRLLATNENTALAHPVVKPDHLSFNKKESYVKINGQIIKLPYASNQYYLCEAVFAHPNKRWEQDELLEKFGDEDSSNWRKVYDAMLAVNKKLGFKLVTYEDKTYRMNPDLVKHLIHEA